MIACYIQARPGATNVIPGEVADKMFMVPAKAAPSLAQAAPDEASLKHIEDTQFAAFSDRIKNENFAWIQAEEDRLDRYAADIEIELDAQIDTLETEVKELQRQKRSPDLSMEDKVALSRKVKRMEGDVDDLKLSKFERRKKVRRDVSDKLDEFAESLNKHPTMTPLMTIRWTVE